jgi:hypothetical protein
MRFLLGCVVALSMMSAGCSDPEGTGGSGGSVGTGGTGGDGGGGGVATCVDSVCPCTEAGIRGAITEGGGPFRFDCDGPQTVVTEAEIIIDNDVILDGEGKLTVDGNNTHGVFAISSQVTAELHRLAVTHGNREWEIRGGGAIANEGTLLVDDCVISQNMVEPDVVVSLGGGGIWNAGQMTITDSAIVDNRTTHSEGGGIHNDQSGTLTLRNSTVAGNSPQMDGNASVGGGISNDGEMIIVNSTISENEATSEGNSGAGILNCGRLSLVNSTISGNRSEFGEDAIEVEWTYASRPEPQMEISGTLIGGKCTYKGSATFVSHGHNIESPGNTCGFDQETDQGNVTEEQLNLGELAANGGPTMTHKPGDGDFGDGSVAIDQIPAEDCEVDKDQRGLPRPAGTTDPKRCDVGAFEVQP